jgi:hypothetical protein
MRAGWWVWLVAALLALSWVDAADAQRGRRKGKPPPKQAPSPAQVEADPPAPDANPYGEPDEAEAEAPAAEEQKASEPPARSAAAEEAFDALFDGPDLTPLREELSALMDELVQMRSRMAVLGRQLFQTRVRVRVHNRAQRRQSLARVALSLDGAPVFQHEGDVGKDARQVFEGFAAPGPHQVTLEVEQRGRDGDDYRYTLRDTFRFEVVRGKLTDVLIVLDDKSNMAKAFPRGGEGEYDVRTRVRVATRDLDAR